MKLANDFKKILTVIGISTLIFLAIAVILGIFTLIFNEEIAIGLVLTWLMIFIVVLVSYMN